MGSGCGQLSGCCSGVPGSGCVRQCITAQVRLYNLGTVECRVGLFSFNVPGQFIGQYFVSRGQAECCNDGQELANLWASGPGV